MKKTILMIFVMSLFVFSSCLNNTEGSVEVNYQFINADWYEYADAQELSKKANAVFIGKVTGIYFKMLDLTTLRSPTESTLDTDRSIVSMYNIDILTTYKGDVQKSINLMISSGIKDYRVEEQIELLGKYAEKGIPVFVGMPEIRIGET